jgi:hypothetical protein
MSTVARYFEGFENPVPEATENIGIPFSAPQQCTDLLAFEE